MGTTASKPKKARKMPLPRSNEHKLRSVREVLDGSSAVKVARAYGDSPRAVAYWVTRFKAHGKAGLDVLPRSGRPTKLSAVQLEKVGKHIEHAARAGEPLSGAVLARLIKKEFRIKLTRRHCVRLLSKFGPPSSSS